MKKQTAIQWLTERIFYDYGIAYSDVEIWNYAQEMEREQIIEAYSNGWHDGQDVILQQVKHIDKGGDDAGQKLYNETYK
ncbi:MAG: hypothetical protein ACK528_13600 [Alphaproteobacteria bacterium]|jgi:hypothetical protein